MTDAGARAIDRGLALRWYSVAVGLAVLISPVAVWDFFGHAPLWAETGALVALGLALVCVLVGTVIKGGADRVSALRLIGRLLWAPIRFLFVWTF